MRVWKTKLKLWCGRQLPKWLVESATIRLVAHATTGKYGATVVPDLTAMDALRRWETA